MKIKECEDKTVVIKMQIDTSSKREAEFIVDCIYHMMDERKLVNTSDCIIRIPLFDTDIEDDEDWNEE